MKAAKDLGSQAETRQRLLDAAGEVFAERGFRSATTREICRRADANVAAINYHFGDKERLYEAAVRYAQEHANERYPLADVADPGASPVERLRNFVERLLSRALCEGRPAWQAKLLAREMIEPTAVLDTLVESDFRPILEALDSICRELLGPGATPKDVRLATRSVVGQCVYYRHARAVITRLYPEEQYEPEDIRRLAEYITAFSVGGMERLAGSGAPGTGAPPDEEG